MKMAAWVIVPQVRDCRCSSGETPQPPHPRVTLAALSPFDVDVVDGSRCSVTSTWGTQRN